MTDSQAICAKCAHILYQHENADLTAGKCRYPGCRCRLFHPTWRAELEAMGIKPVAPDHWVYRQGTVFVIPDVPTTADEDS